METPLEQQHGTSGKEMSELPDSARSSDTSEKMGMLRCLPLPSNFF